MKQNRTLKRKVNRDDQIARYEMEKRALYYTCKTQEELNRKLLELAKKIGI